MIGKTKSRALVLLLMGGYLPFLLGVIGGTGFAAYCLGRWAWTVAEELSIGAALLLLVPVLILAGCVLSLVAACLAFFGPADLIDPLELRLPPKAMKGLLRLVREVAEQLSLPAPDEVRLHSESLAHVYEEDGHSEKKRILVIGGAALASLDRTALGGVIAHELGHFAGGDTALSRRAFRWHRMMMHVELALIEMPWNPLGWLLRGYHVLFRWAWAADRQVREYAADRHEVQLVGKKQAALTLIALTVIEEMPWSRLTSVAEWFAMMPTREKSVFAEQVRRARQASTSEWEDACRRALKRKTGMFDSHPCLRDRLRAIGVSAKKAIALAAKLRPGEADPAEFIDGWDAIESAMSAFLIELVQIVQQDKRDMAAIIMGRPVG